MSEIILKFNGRFREPMLSGVKVCTLRRDVKAKIGDTFHCWDEQWQVIRVDAATPDWVSENRWREEGFDGPDDFRQFWRKIHPRGRLDTPHVHIWFGRVA